MQNRNGVTDVENKHVCQGRKRWGGIHWEVETDMSTLLIDINNLRYAGTTVTAESEGEPKGLLMSVEESVKTGLKLNTQKLRL